MVITFVELRMQKKSEAASKWARIEHISPELNSQTFRHSMFSGKRIHIPVILCLCKSSRRMPLVTVMTPLLLIQGLSWVRESDTECWTCQLECVPIVNCHLCNSQKPVRACFADKSGPR